MKLLLPINQSIHLRVNLYLREHLLTHLLQKWCGGFMRDLVHNVHISHRLSMGVVGVTQVFGMPGYTLLVVVVVVVHSCMRIVCSNERF